VLKQISHLGIAVKNLEQAMDFYKLVFHVPVSSPITAGDIKVSMVKVGDASIELIQPISNKGVIAKFLEKHGEGIHHVCFEVDDMASAIESLRARGIEPVRDPAPGAEGLSAFLHPKGTFGMLIELVQKD